MSAAIPTAAVVALLAAATAAAQPSDQEPAPSGPARPSESDLFGAPPTKDGPGEPPPGEAPPKAGEAPTTEERLFGRLRATDNPLDVGGLLYARSFLAARQGDPASRWSLSAPSLLDVYLDAHPSDRVRGFVLGRLQYDPTITSTSGSASATTSSSGTTTTPSLPGQVTSSTANPSVLLDQLWLRFDVSRIAFVTAGKQHVKWGTGRFWNPTDYLHTVRRDPLAIFDQRTGTSMVRVDFPVEKLGWNFQAIAILEPLTTIAATGSVTSQTSTGSTPVGTVGGVGGAARAQVVLGPAELGAGVILQRGHKPRFAFDASAGFWEIDVYGEAAVKTGSEVPLWQPAPGVTADTPLLQRYQTYEATGPTPQITAGARWGHKYSDEDRFELGAEYFFNDTGYTDRAIYPVLLLNNAFTPFYLGKHYGAVYLHLPNPGSWNRTTFLLTTVGNLSDRSFVTRLDHSMVLLTYLRLETFVQVHYGTPGGEFRLGLSIPPQDLGGGVTSPAVSLGNPIVDAGIALRLTL